MPKRQYANDAEHADAAVITLVVFICILVVFKFVVLLVEQQFLERIRQSIELLVIELIQRV